MLWKKLEWSCTGLWWIDNYFPNIGNCFPRELASFGIRINLLYEVSANVPKEFKTLMLIYFLSISTQMFLSKSILTGISLLLPAIWNSRENSQKKSISNFTCHQEAISLRNQVKTHYFIVKPVTYFSFKTSSFHLCLYIYLDEN